MADIFLSYSSQDRERIRPLVKAIEQQGWSVWWDPRIPLGKTWRQHIQQALDDARCVVVAWSKNSIKSKWVIEEAEEGQSREILIPVLIDDIKAPLGFRSDQAARLMDWQGESSHHELESLFDAVSSILGKPEPAKGIARQSVRTDEVLVQSPEPAKEEAAQKPQVNDTAAPSYEFDFVTMDAKGNVIERRKGRARYFFEVLSPSVKLAMVEIPGGEFIIGSPETEDERAGREGPQHQVKVPPFLIGKHQVTQAQWRAVAGFPKAKIDLNPDSSYFKGDNLPVEQVSWNDAIEFCVRLSRKTGRTYRLPTEAEWEYAARAGTTTPFAFGETITPEIVNYDGNYPYASAPKGEYRGKTVEVGSLGVANAFGLHDMHGNVFEWCEDVWHDSYNGLSTDGSAWLSGGDSGRRVLRGDSFGHVARYCRSAYRIENDASSIYRYIGFRVVVSASTLRFPESA